MSIGLAIGLVIDLGGLLGQGEGASGGSTETGGGDGGGDFLSDVADMVGGVVDERRMIQVPFRNIPKAIKNFRMLPFFVPSLALAAEKTGSKAWYHNFAFYIGPVIDVGFLYFTAGACLGGFGCLAGGGGLKLGNFGIGVLFPFWKWWWYSFPKVFTGAVFGWPFILGRKIQELIPPRTLALSLINFAYTEGKWVYSKVVQKLVDNMDRKSKIQIK